jgi:hypothetical protein
MGIQAERVAAPNMSAPGALERAQTAGWIPYSFNFSGVTAGASGVNVSRVYRSVGRLAAHFRALARILDAGPAIGLVLEDNAWIESDFVIRLWNLVSSELPCDWDVLSLRSRCGYGQCISPHLSRVAPDANEVRQTCRSGVNLGLNGMLYRTGGIKAVQTEWMASAFHQGQSPACLHADAALASTSDRVAYYAVPACQSPGFLRLGEGEDEVEEDRAIQVI